MFLIFSAIDLVSSIIGTVNNHETYMHIVFSICDIVLICSVLKDIKESKKITTIYGIIAGIIYIVNLNTIDIVVGILIILASVWYFFTIKDSKKV